MIRLNSRKITSEIWRRPLTSFMLTQSAFTCSNLTIETLEQDVDYVQS